MKKHKRFTVAVRRKRKGKTNYKKRLRLLLSSKPRLVVRTSSRNVLGQIIVYNGVTCDGFVDTNRALAIGLDLEGAHRVIISASHFQLICDPLTKKSYTLIEDWLFNH